MAVFSAGLYVVSVWVLHPSALYCVAFNQLCFEVLSKALSNCSDCCFGKMGKVDRTRHDVITARPAEPCKNLQMLKVDSLLMSAVRHTAEHLHANVWNRVTQDRIKFGHLEALKAKLKAIGTAVMCLLKELLGVNRTCLERRCVRTAYLTPRYQLINSS